MSTPTSDTPVDVRFEFHLEHMDLRCSVSNGSVRIDAPDFVRLMEQARPQHAGLFADTLKQILLLTTDAATQPDAAAQPGAHRRMFDALASVGKVQDALNDALSEVTSELARLTAMPRIFEDELDAKTLPPSLAQPPAAESAPAGTPEASPPASAPNEATDPTPAAPTPSATTEPAAPTPPANS